PSAAVRVNTPVPDTANDDIEALYWLDASTLLYLGEQDTTNIWELYAVTFTDATPSAPVKVSGAMVAGGEVNAEDDVFVSPDGTREIFLADKDTLGTDELFIVDFSGGAPSAPAKVNPPFTQGFESVLSGLWSPDGRRFLYAADQLTS